MSRGRRERDEKHEPQEGVTLAVRRDLRLLGAQGEAEFRFEDLPDECQRLLRLLGFRAEDHEVVGVSREAIPSGFELPVQAVEHDVRQQRRDDSSLGRAQRRVLKVSFVHHPGSEKSFDQVKDVSVRHLGSHCVHDDRVRNVVEEPLNVSIEYGRVPLAVEFQDARDRLVSIPSGMKPKEAG